MRKKKYRSSSVLRSLIPGLLLFAAIVSMVLSGLKGADGLVSDEGIKTARDSIYRAVVTCYSIESRYPDSYEYLKERYGVSVDETRYIIHYEIFAANIMPVITVVGRRAQ